MADDVLAFDGQLTGERDFVIALARSPEQLSKLCADLEKLVGSRPIVADGNSVFTWTRKLSDDELRAVQWYMRRQVEA